MRNHYKRGFIMFTARKQLIDVSKKKRFDKYYQSAF